MIELFENKQDCCGCTACANICPKSAIEMCEDSEGFKYPSINLDKCIECSLCKKVCAFQCGYDTTLNLPEPLVYAAKHKDENIRKSSTSGGIFTAISDYVLHISGVIYGVAYDKEMNVAHERAESKEQREEFKGSKYVQSDLGEIFKQVAQDLKDNRYVLFTGTPCQCAGLKRYVNILKINQEQLILCDIVCHGVPSPVLWKEHIKLSEHKHRSNIKEYYCRSKILGWRGHNEMSVYENGKVDYQTPFSQKHKKIFYSCNALRPSCHNCKFTNLKRCSDFTIADFWGIEKYMPDFDDNKGISLILVNTPKGSQILFNIKNDIEYRQSNTTDCLQPQLQYPTIPSPMREAFWQDYYSKGYNYIIKKYASCGFKDNLKYKVKIILKKANTINIVRKIFRKDQ